jgi:hypothetical protein
MRSEAAELLGEWEGSGEKMSQWCEDRGLNWYSLNAHKGREASLPRVAFAEVVLADAEVVASVGRYRVELGDIVVEVDDHFRADTLRRLVQVIAAC